MKKHVTAGAVVALALAIASPIAQAAPAAAWISFHDSGQIFIVDLPRAPESSTDSIAVSGAVHGLARNGRTVTSDAVVVLDGQTGRHIELTGPGDQQTSDLIFLVKRQLIQVMVVEPSKPSAAQAAERDRFLKAFHFTVR
jgi:hypothetical protein